MLAAYFYIFLESFPSLINICSLFALLLYPLHLCDVQFGVAHEKTREPIAGRGAGLEPQTRQYQSYNSDCA